MCGPEKGHNTWSDARREAETMAFREGVLNRRMGESGGNGKLWDTWWKILSLVVLPWATAITILVWNLTVTTTKMQEDLRHTHEEYDRRLKTIEVQMDPVKRFYRWDGEALGDRIDELESLHPRERRTP